MYSSTERTFKLSQPYWTSKYKTKSVVKKNYEMFVSFLTSLLAALKEASSMQFYLLLLHSPFSDIKENHLKIFEASLSKATPSDLRLPVFQLSWLVFKLVTNEQNILKFSSPA